MHESLGDGLLDRPQDRRHIGGIVVRSEQEMHMLGHEHPRIQAEAVRRAGRRQRLHEYLANRRRGEERQTAMTGEGQEANLPDDFAAAKSLADGRRLVRQGHRSSVHGA